MQRLRSLGRAIAMIGRLLLLWMSALPLTAQLELFTVIRGTEKPVSGLLSMGSTPTGEPLDVLIRVRNIGSSLATITTFHIQGENFALASAPSPPVGLVAGRTLDFYVRFLSVQPAADARASLHLNLVTITLLATAVAAPNLFYVDDDGTRIRRLSDQAIVFPPVERGSRSERRFLVENPFDASVVIDRIGVSGDSFSSGAVATPWRLPPRSSHEIVIAFQPTTSGLKLGTLTLDDGRFPLEGVAREAPFPRPRLTIGPDAQLSGKQVRVSVIFDAQSRADGAGVLRLEFQPALPGPEDPAVTFITSRSRTIPFVVKSGESQALFSNQRDTLLQTGTTAGTLRITAEMGGFTTENTIQIAAAPVVVDTLTIIRQVDILDLTVKGFDNSRSASSVAFTFFDASGAQIQPGELRSDVADRFTRYFETAPAGGMFALRAVFPATGSTTSITAVEIEFRNKTGSQRTPRMAF